MASNVIRVDSSARKLISMVRDLYKSCDVEVHVGETVFKCHKLVLTMQSSYFRERFFSATISSITLDDVAPVDFQNIQMYFNKGEIELDTTNVANIFLASKLFVFDSLREVCLQYLGETFAVTTCVDYWKAVESEVDLELHRNCLNLFVDKFNHFIKTADLNMIPQTLMQRTLERNDLNVRDEETLCEILLKWFDANQVNWQLVQPLKLLSLVRWSGVSVEYLTSNMICNDLLQKDQPVLAYLLRVLSYRITGTQYRGLLTCHRRSTNLFQYVVVFGTDSGSELTLDIQWVSLQKQNVVAKINEMPSTRKGVIASINGASVYVTGPGSHCNETWRWDLVGGWVKCGNMVEGRTSHFATFVNTTTMYALGGFVFSSMSNIWSVEKFNTRKFKWTTVGKLARPVYGAGGAAHKSLIYLFGGGYYDTSTKTFLNINSIQQYDTMTEQSTIMACILPVHQSYPRAVLFDEKVILMHKRTCCIFNLDTQTVERRDRFKADVDKFGLVIDNQTLFVIGGDKEETDSNGEEKWVCTDVVKCIPVMDVIDDKQTVTWTQHAKLKLATQVYCYCIMTLASKNN